MRKLLIVVLQLLALGFFAQAPKEVNYQGVARDAFGVPIGNKAMRIRFEIFQGTNTATAVFTETQSIVTNSLGLFTTQIGKNPTLGTINLENGILQLRVSLDTTGGTNFIVLGTPQKISSVPFAMHAGSVPTTFSNNVLTVGSKTLDVTPQVTYTNSVLRVGPASNTVLISTPAASITGSGAVNVTTLTANSFSLHVPTQSLSLLSPGTLSITGGNSLNIVPSLAVNGTSLSVGAAINAIQLPTVALTASGLAQVTGGPLNYNMNVPLLTYNSSTGDLSSGSNNTNITPVLALNGSTLSVGPLANKVDLSVLAPWRDAVTTVTLATNTSLVGVGTGAPNAKLDVQHNGTNSALNAQNTNVSTTAYAATFDGGIVTKGKNTLSTASALIAQNSAGTDIFAVRNNADMVVGTTALVLTGGNLGISNASPTQKLDVTGNVRFSGAIMPNNLPGTAGQFLQSNGANTPPLWTTGGLLSAGTTNYLPKWSTATGLTSTSLVFDNGTNVGIGNNNPQQKLDVTGNMRVTHTSLITGYAGEVANTTASGGQSSGGLLVTNSGLRSIGHNGMTIDNITTKTGGNNSNKTGLEINSTGAWGTGGSGGHFNRGLVVNVSGGVDGNYAALFNGGNVGIGINNPSSSFAIGNGSIQKLGISGVNGSMVFTDEQGTITFPAAVTPTLYPMINMFASGVSNAKRMVLQHSPSFPTYGLQYEDQTDRFHFIGNDQPVLTADLASFRVGIGTNAPIRKFQVVDNTGLETSLVQNLTTGGGTAIHGEVVTAGSGARFGVTGEVSGSNASGFQTGVQGTAGGGTQSFGVWGVATGGSTTYNIGVIGNQGGGTGSYGGYFNGPVQVNGLLSKTAGTFRIDHPQDPTNKYLIHSFVESPDMMNIYNGNITTDANGDALVQLPSYFEAENIQFRYQLTVLGQFAQAIVLEEIQNNQFKIKTDKPNVKVSWQVTGVRNDEFAKQHRVVPEVEKTGKDKGRYIHPELYGFGIEMREGPGNPNDVSH